MPKGASRIAAEDLDDGLDDDSEDEKEDGDESNLSNQPARSQKRSTIPPSSGPKQPSRGRSTPKSSRGRSGGRSGAYSRASAHSNSSTSPRAEAPSKYSSSAYASQHQGSNPLAPKPMSAFQPTSPTDCNDAPSELTLVVLGHVDAGKSTLIGRILQDLTAEHSQFSAGRMKKNALAWSLDQRSDERERGITMDLGVAHLQAGSNAFTILDAPGHKDFVPRAIAGAAQAECAIIVVDASPGEFETGISSGGQTKEHAHLAKTLGVQHVIVAVNKLDRCDDPQSRFYEVFDGMSSLLERAGFAAESITHVPVSALYGYNVLTGGAEMFGVEHASITSLFDALSRLQPSDREVNKPLRFLIADAAQGSSNLSSASSNAASGRVESGTLSVGDKVLLMPNGAAATVKAIEARGERTKRVFAGSTIDLSLEGLNEHDLTKGGVLCDPSFPVPMATELRVRLMVAEDAPMPLLPGASLVAYIGFAEQPASVLKLHSLLDESGRERRAQPRALPKGAAGSVSLALESSVPAEREEDIARLGRVALRERGHTVALGAVEAVQAMVHNCE